MPVCKAKALTTTEVLKPKLSASVKRINCLRRLLSQKQSWKNKNKKFYFRFFFLFGVELIRVVMMWWGKLFMLVQNFWILKIHFIFCKKMRLKLETRVI